MFKKAIVRKPSKSMVKGLTTAKLGSPDFNLALIQHQKYIEALIECGLDVTILDADEHFPDSTFVEDTAILTPNCAIITNPGALSRKGEVLAIEKAVSGFYQNIEKIVDKGTVDGGDIMMVDKHFYIGRSERTNREGAKQLTEILEKYELTASTVTLEKMLHLKSGLSYLENNNLVITDEFVERSDFKKFNKLIVNESEVYAANCVWINDQVLIATGYPKTKQIIEKAGYKTIELDMSEYRKLDGGLSCLSLRF
ncbi:MAG: N(G),N(G)-dimethylarginine dimethylaminohydrolase [Bacteroidetes bacterium]|nr:MAG: N(G),N(G)-dimethylarginine dimethylaminohydrolase [Bacteroidota bacterium]